MIAPFSYLTLLLVVAPINAEKNAAEGRKVRLSIIEESDETKKRESVMTPYPRVSDGI